MQNTINSIAEFETIKEKETAFVLYITDNTCNVGENVEPKLEKLLAENFPKLKLYKTYISDAPELVGQLSVFTVPTVLVYFECKQYIQKSRAFSLGELEQEIDRYYQMIFEE
ncbi:MAG TPA: thioredoxin [Flavobacteriaceae bacterium]|jgi:thioredoxin-like negative regulator of GroEL|nr:thioredoxin [Flavobacteriaceae bacterium]